MAYAPTLTPYTDAAPCPRVEVFFDAFAPGTETVTVLRMSGGRTFPVRGAVRAATAGSMTRIDFECPFNMSVAYRAEMLDAAGLSLGFTDTATLGDVVDELLPGDDVLPANDLLPFSEVVGQGLVSAVTWMHDPLHPAGAVPVELYPSTGAEISRPVPGTISRPRGRRGGVVLAELRQGVSGLRFDVVTTDLATADRVQALLGGEDRTTVPVVCVRLGGDERRLRVPQPLFLGVLDIVEVGLTVRWGGGDTLQKMVGDEVDPPVPGLVVPLLTAADLNVFYATAAALNGDNLTAAAANRRYDLAGTASA